jgi:hypothetical protein
MNKGDETRKLKTIGAKPRFRIDINPNMPTLIADFVKCVIDFETQLVTLIFFDKHFLPERAEDGSINLNKVIDEAFLEIKVPFNAAFALALYMNAIFKEIQENQIKDGIHFGP